MLFTRKPATTPSREEAPPGGDEAMRVPAAHLMLGDPLTRPFPEGTEQAIFGMGCFWGADRPF